MPKNNHIIGENREGKFVLLAGPNPKNFMDTRRKFMELDTNEGDDKFCRIYYYEENLPTKVKNFLPEKEAAEKQAIRQKNLDDAQREFEEAEALRHKNQGRPAPKPVAPEPKTMTTEETLAKIDAENKAREEALKAKQEGLKKPEPLDSIEQIDAATAAKVKAEMEAESANGKAGKPAEDKK